MRWVEGGGEKVVLVHFDLAVVDNEVGGGRDNVEPEEKKTADHDVLGCERYCVGLIEMSALDIDHRQNTDTPKSSILPSRFSCNGGGGSDAPAPPGCMYASIQLHANDDTRHAQTYVDDQEEHLLLAQHILTEIAEPLRLCCDSMAYSAVRAPLVGCAFRGHDDVKAERVLAFLQMRVRLKQRDVLVEHNRRLVRPPVGPCDVLAPSVCGFCQQGGEISTEATGTHMSRTDRLLRFLAFGKYSTTLHAEC